MTEPVNLNVARAEKEGDCRLQSVEDALEDALREARDGRWTKAVMVFYRPAENGRFAIDSRYAGCSCLEARGLMMTEIRSEILAALED